MWVGSMKLFPKSSAHFKTHFIIGTLPNKYPLMRVFQDSPPLSPPSYWFLFSLAVFVSNTFESKRRVGARPVTGGHIAYDVVELWLA